jgi:hypothetical protein
MTVYFRKLNNGNDSLFENIIVKDDHIPICLERPNKDPDKKPDKFFAQFRSSYQLLKEIAETEMLNRCFFEIIRGYQNQKHYLDIDMKLEDDNFAEKFPHSIEEKINIAENICQLYKSALMKLKPQIKDRDIIITNSHSNSKRSFHIIVDRWFLPNATQNKELFLECIEHIPLPYRKYFDHSMYKNLQQFRTLFSTKCGKNRFKNIDKNSTWKCDEHVDTDEKKIRELFYASLITEVSGCNMLSFNVKEKTEFVDSRNLDNSELNIVQRHFKSFKDFNKFEICSNKNSIIPLKRRSPSYCDVCQRTHDSENAFLFVTFDNKLYFNCRRNEKSQLISDLKTNDDGVIVNNENDNKLAVYKPPSISYDVKVTDFGDKGILDLSKGNYEFKESNSYPHLDLLIKDNQDVELSSSKVVYENKVKKYLVVSDSEKTETQRIINEARARYQRNPKEQVSTIKKLANFYNNIHM